MIDYVSRITHENLVALLDDLLEIEENLQQEEGNYSFDMTETSEDD